MASRLRIGLTGGIASGKSTVERRLTELGVPVINADDSARAVVAHGQPGLARVIERFGSGISTRDGELDRPALRALVFRDPEKRRDLEAILHPLIREQELRLTISDRVYYREIARARTFALLRDIEGLQKIGLAKGGSLENAIVVDDFNVLNPEGLRFADEFVRHKVLDVMGDLALCGMPVIGHFTSYKSGHTLNQMLVRRLVAPGDAAEIVEVREKRQLEKLALGSSAFGLSPVEN